MVLTREEAWMEGLLRHELVGRVVLPRHEVHVNGGAQLGQYFVQQRHALHRAGTVVLGQVPAERSVSRLKKKVRIHPNKQCVDKYCIQFTYSLEIFESV